MVDPGDDAEHGHACTPLDHVDGWLQERGIASEAVDHEAPHERLILGREQLQCAEKVREHAASVDIPDEERDGLRVTGDPHVHYVRRLQVRLGGAARTLHDHEVVALP